MFCGALDHETIELQINTEKTQNFKSTRVGKIHESKMKRGAIEDEKSEGKPT